MKVTMENKPNSSSTSNTSGRLKFDVVIIGASTSGLYAAVQLSRAGKRVAVFDRKRKLNYLRRTLIVTSEVSEILPQLPSVAAPHKTGTLRLQALGSTRMVSLQKPDLIVERSQIALWLLSQSKAAGAQICSGYRFSGFEVVEKSVRVVFNSPSGKEAVEVTDAIIGSDGINSKVGQIASISPPPLVSIVQAEVRLPLGWNSNVTQVWFDAEDTQFFYWLVPESNSRGVVGLIANSGVQARRLLASFLKRHNLKAEAYQAAKVALYHPRLKPWKKIGGCPVLMVGDAAGQVKNTTVGGTVTGIRGAEAAVQSILNGTSYASELRSLKRELNLHWLIRLMLNRLDNHGYCVLVNALSGRLKEFLSRNGRDSMSSVFWFLPFVEPRLLRMLPICFCGKSRFFSRTRNSTDSQPIVY